MLKPHALASKYCVGNGVELGAAAYNPFYLPNCPNIAPSDGVNFLYPRDLEDYQGYVRDQERAAGAVRPVDKIGDFRHIPADTASLDYVISSHVIEHEPNPIAALLESARVLKEGGIFFCMFPKRNAEIQFDIFRPLTLQDELILAYTEDRKVDTFPPPLGSDRWRSHHYVYSLQSMLRLINWINRQKLATFCVEAVEETDSKVGNSHTVVLRKMLPEQMLDANATLFVEQLLRAEEYESAFLAAKVSLSFDFFQTLMLYTTALLATQMKHFAEAREFYRQCLIQDPECEARRREFFELFGEYYVNPLP
ncbi:MAG: class I SAM-dependent methyltransferase [Zoogloeaceae bacterium]|jgi:SAM-dependent methyltransferase|nr:class I SAM-dependent methyltransferase [Zoogloeaceae bacterium]